MHQGLSPGRFARSILALWVATWAVAVPSHAQTPEPDEWTREKCVRYERAFRQLLPSVAPKGVTDGFIKGNESFIAAGCSNGADVCPNSPADFELANALTIAAMNFGTASTFLPFVCR